VVVYVAGEVLKPGVYELAAGARTQAALARAGGPKPDADLVAVNLAAPVDDGTEIVFPKIGESAPRVGRSTRPREHSGRASPKRRHGGRTKPRTTPSRTVDLNSADAGELQTVPGLGPALAARIVAFREANGRFASLDELADVSGITPSLQEKLADFIVIR
jgi:competence protein ComEA